MSTRQRGVVAIRVDSSHEIGTGHVMRCLTLAAELRRRGVTVHFVTREHAGHIGDRVASEGFGISMLKGATRESQSGYARWLGATQDEDSEQTAAALANLQAVPDWLVVDHYGIDCTWERKMRRCAGSLFVIDDLANREHDCDVVLDQNLVPHMSSRYSGKVGRARTLLGPRFALLRPEYRTYRDRIPERNGVVRNILISFGGVDTCNMTGRALDALIALGREDLTVNVVVTDGFPHAHEIRRTAAAHEWIRVHGPAPTLAPLMATADIAIGASGATSWERVCLGLPSLVISLADNQRAIASGLSDAGVATWLGHADEVTVADIASAVKSAVEQGNSEQASRRCRELIDGLGTSRVCHVLYPESEYHLRVVGQHDSRALFDLGLIDDKEVLDAALRDVECSRPFVAVDRHGAEVGFILLMKFDGAWRVLSSRTGEPSKGVRESLCAAAVSLLRLENKDSLVFGSENLDEDIASIVVCSDESSWINETVATLVSGWMSAGHRVQWVHHAVDAVPADICFYLSYSRIVPAEQLAKFSNNLVVHASDLPRGRGWSPLTWQILEGKNSVVVTLFEAAQEVDSGPIYLQQRLDFNGAELVDDLRAKVALATRVLAEKFVATYPEILKTAKQQVGEATYYPRRRPADGLLDIDGTIRSQFNLLRTADSSAYPAWFELAGERFAVHLRRLPRSS